MKDPTIHLSSPQPTSTGAANDLSADVDLEKTKSGYAGVSTPRQANIGGSGSPKQKNDSSNSVPDVLLEGWMLKKNRHSHWQDRYFVFKSDQTISYKKKQDDENARVTFRVSTEAGCEVSDLFVAQRSVGPGVGGGDGGGSGKASGSVVGAAVGTKETLYCFTLSWPDDTETVGTANLTHHTASPGGDHAEGQGLGTNGGGDPTDVSFQNDDASVLAYPINSTMPTSPLSVTSHKQRGLLRKLKMSSVRGAVIDDNGSIKSSQSLNSRASQIRKSILRRAQLKRGRSAPASDGYDRHLELFPRKNNRIDNECDDGSFASLLDPPKSKQLDDGNNEFLRIISSERSEKKTPSRTFPASAVAALGMSMPNIKVELKPRITKIPNEVTTDGPIFESTRIDEEDDDSEHKGDDDVCLMPENSDDIATLRQRLKDEYGVMTPTANEKKSSYEDQTLIEQEMLQIAFLRKQREQRSAMTKRAVGITKVAVAASAAIGVGIVTAGVGLAAGLVFLGGAAAIGAGTGVAEVGLRRTLKRKDHLTIATANYDLAKLWKTMLDSCLEQESLKRSTWGQLFVADGRNTTTTFIAHDTGDMNYSLSGDDDDVDLSRVSNAHKDFQNGRSKLFLRDSKFFSYSRARWRPLDGGWMFLLGSGAPGIRIFKEEKIRQMVDATQKVAPLAVQGSTTPLKTQVVLNAHPMEAFMCIMSYARMLSDDPVPNSGQSASFRLVEKIDEHTDVLHLVSRKLFLFPSWTEARDFVLLRYWRYEPDGSYIICYESIEHSRCPPQPGFVRGDMHQVYTISPPKISDHRRLRGTNQASEECMLTVVVQVDPKGWIPIHPLSLLSNQSYADAFGIAALHQTLDIRDAIENDRFLESSPDFHSSASSSKSDAQLRNLQDVSDLRYVGRERCDSHVSFPDIASTPEPLLSEKWAEPDSNSFLVRGPSYLSDRKKINAGVSIGQLIAVDVVEVDEPQYGGMSMHPSERIQLALQREKKLKGLGKESDVPPFIFCVNIILPVVPVHHGVFYFAVEDMTTIDGSDGTPSSKLCQQFFFGDSDEFRDNTFKLIPRIVEGNFLVRKAVGSTPAIMGTKLKQYYVRHERFMEVILDCGSSPVATGVIRLSLGYAKTLVVDMCFLLEGDTEEHLPERVFGAVRMKYPTFDEKKRKVESMK